jgi:hypothetical protein
MDGRAWGARPANDLDELDDLAEGLPPPDVGSPGVARLLLRFSMGLAGLARERIDAILAAPNLTAGTPATVEAGVGHGAFRSFDVALGLVLGAADSGARARPRLRSRWAQVIASARWLSAPLVRACGLIGWLPGVPRRAADLRAWRVREGRRLARWASAGRRERAESRALARAALITARETILARIADSPDVKRVIREQSEGIAVTAVGELRERSAQVDDLAEGAVGRLLGRGRTRQSR